MLRTLQILLIFHSNFYVAEVALNRSKIIFYLHSKNVHVGHIIKYMNIEDLRSSTYEPSLKTKFIIHGFQSSCEENVFHLIKNAYLSVNDYNIFCVDWSSKFSYSEAIESLQFVGQNLALFIDWLVSESGLNLEDVHIIGHSLGAHVAGIAGFNVKYGWIDRITGLDPAVLLISFESGKCLSINDARTIELIFTSFLSAGHPLGNVNYFVNGGIEQPHCNSIIGMKYGGSVVCSHSYSYEIFALSIKYPEYYRAYRCSGVEQAILRSCNGNEEHFFSDNLDYIYDGIYSIN